MPKLKRTHLIVGGVVLVGLAGAVLLLGHGKKAPKYATATVTKGDIVQTVLATGTLQPSQLVSVGAQVSGRVESLKVALGDFVEKGQVIAVIDAVPASNQLKTAQATLAQQIAQRSAQAATLAQANATLERQNTTFAADASSRADLEAAVASAAAAKASLAALDAQISQARVSVDTARVNLSYTNIVAPISGRVLAVVTKQGQTVNAVQAAPTIVILGDMSTMTIKAQISEADAVKVHPGQQATFTILGAPNRNFRGQIRSLAPAPNSIVSEVTNTTTTTTAGSTAVYYDGLFDTPNTDGVLRADMTAQVTVTIAQAKNVVTVPSAAIDLPPPAEAASSSSTPPARSGPSGGANRHSVLVLDAKGKLQSRTITTGLTNSVDTEVLSGLAAGDHVVVGIASAQGAGAGSPGRPPGPGPGGRPL